MRVSIGIAKDKNATQPEHELAPQPLNGWPLFGNRKNNVGEVPLAGPNDNTPLEVGIDLTPLLELSGSDYDLDGRLFLRFSNAKKSDASGMLHACAIRSYDAKGGFVSESPIEIPDGNFGKSVLRIEAPLLQPSGL